VDETLSLALLAAILVVTVARPRGLPEVAVAAPAALLLLGVGALSWDAAGREARSLGPTLGFLAAVLVLGHLADREGLFAAAGHALARGSRGRPARLMGLVFALASAVTAVLSLDATVVLLTPVVLATAGALALPARPHTHACVHLANSASLLLPVSNLTNLLALRATGVGFGRFGALMALPWIAAIAVEWVVLRRAFAADLRAAGAEPPRDPVRLPRLPLVVIALTLAGFLVEDRIGLDPAVVAAIGAAALAVPALARRRASPADLVRAAAPAFLVFVLALGLVVRAAVDGGLGDAVARLVPGGAGLLALLGVAAGAAVLANLVNNLPATLILLPVIVPHGLGPVLAMLIGVNVGPNLTPAGSLATLLWRRALPADGDGASAPGLLLRLGLLAVPPAIVLATAALWLALRV
jgi:arsenical pump membrane protein